MYEAHNHVHICKIDIVAIKKVHVGEMPCSATSEAMIGGSRALILKIRRELPLQFAMISESWAKKGLMKRQYWYL